MYDPDAMLNRRVLVVADDPAVQAQFLAVLGSEPTPGAPRANWDARGGGAPREFALDFASRGTDALDRVRQAVIRAQRYAVALIDARRPPDWNGLEIAARLRNLDRELQTVICTDAEGPTADDVVAALGESESLLVLRKPWEPAALRLLVFHLVHAWGAWCAARREMPGLRQWAIDTERVLSILKQSHDELEVAHMAMRERAFELRHQIEDRTRETAATQDLAIFALAKLAESRDPETGEHLERMREYCRVLAGELACDGPYAETVDAQFCSDLYRSSPLHDIGKVGIPDEVLLKPGGLTREEFALMKQHTVIGERALRASANHSEEGAFLSMAAEIARHHHERFDGSGYPDGLGGTAIPLAARIVALADVFDALTSVRIYKEAMEPAVARLLIEEQEGGHFDPVVVGTFRRRWDDFLSIYHTSHHGRGLAGKLGPADRFQPAAV